jgi:hypothetical protein
MPIIQNAVKQRLFFSFKITVLSLVCIALIAEIMPEVHAKLIVIPALLAVLILGIIEVKRSDKNQF